MEYMITFEDFSKESNSKFRKMCFKMRQRMILDQCYQLIWILVTGFGVLMAPMLSVVIIYNKYSKTHPNELQSHGQSPILASDINKIAKDKASSQLEYSDSVWPLIWIQGFLLLGLLYSLGALLVDICSSGLVVWHRNNLGTMLCQIIFHFCLFQTLGNLRLYLKSKERRNWMGDIQNDGHLDFYQCFYPIFTVTLLYLCKLVMLIHK